jgi:hypothetical protein
MQTKVYQQPKGPRQFSSVGRKGRASIPDNRVSSTMQQKLADSIQYKPEDEDELKQGKFIQRAKEDEEKLMQGKFIQLAKPEDEELKQGKFIQRAKPEDEELKQGKFIQLAKPEDEELKQGKFTSQRVPNKTGMPDNLKNGVEQLSGLDMGDVKVHYNSSKPAQVQAHAYTQGTDIHVAPGQEKHLGHEAWHVAQQKQGRVQPNTEVAGMPVNDNPGLEHEADVMGGKALGMK